MGIDTFSTSAAAARFPLTTAPSMVAGSPVSVQSPARKRFATSFACPVAAADQGPAKTSPASPVPRLSESAIDRAQEAATLRPPALRAPKFLVGHRDDLGSAARDQRQVRGALSERDPLVEHPLHRPPRQSREDFLHDGPVVPEIHCHDRHRRHACGRVEHGLQLAGPRGAEEPAQAEPGHSSDHGARGEPLAAHLDAFHSARC